MKLIIEYLTMIWDRYPLVNHIIIQLGILNCMHTLNILIKGEDEIGNYNIYLFLFPKNYVKVYYMFWVHVNTLISIIIYSYILNEVEYIYLNIYILLLWLSLSFIATLLIKRELGKQIEEQIEGIERHRKKDKVPIWFEFIIYMENFCLLSIFILLII